LSFWRRVGATALVSFVALAPLVEGGCDGEVGLLRADVASSSATSPNAPGTGVDGGSEEDASPRPVVFARDIRPIIGRSDGPPAGCKRCHYKAGSAAQGYELGGLDLTTLGTLRKGGISSGSSIVIAGDPDGSAIVKKLEGTYARGARMPKDLVPLSAEEIGLVRRWIAEGARGTDEE
jgi:hypothetical protein